MKAIVQRANGDMAFLGRRGSVYAYKILLASQTAEGANAADAIDQTWQVCDAQGNPCEGSLLVHFVVITAASHEIGLAFTGMAVVAGTGYLVLQATTGLHLWGVTNPDGTINLRLTQTGASSNKRVGASVWGGMAPLTVTDALVFAA